MRHTDTARGKTKRTALGRALGGGVEEGVVVLIDRSAVVVGTSGASSFWRV
jgi:hypothetical protein